MRCGVRSTSTASNSTFFCNSAATAAATRFFKRVLAACHKIPNKSASDSSAKAEMLNSRA